VYSGHYPPRGPPPQQQQQPPEMMNQQPPRYEEVTKVTHPTIGQNPELFPGRSI
jgi:hypothetical protein